MRNGIGTDRQLILWCERRKQFMVMGREFLNETPTVTDPSLAQFRRRIVVAELSEPACHAKKTTGAESFGGCPRVTSTLQICCCPSNSGTKSGGHSKLGCRHNQGSNRRVVQLARYHAR